MEARFVYVFVLGILFTGAKDLLRSQLVSAEARLRSRGLWEVYSGMVLLVALLLRAHNLPTLAFSNTLLFHVHTRAVACDYGY